MNPTARGIGIRLIILIIGALLIGFWLIGLAFKMAFAAVHLVLWIGLILLVIGAILVLKHKISGAIARRRR